MMALEAAAGIGESTEECLDSVRINRAGSFPACPYRAPQAIGRPAHHRESVSLRRDGGESETSTILSEVSSICVQELSLNINQGGRVVPKSTRSQVERSLNPLLVLSG
jgi:hypothetical protein